MDDKNRFFILAGNSSYINRGCEAITRGTVHIIRKHFDNPKFLAVSMFGRDDFEQQCLREADSSITHKKMYRIHKRFDLAWFILSSLRVLCPRATKHIVFREMKPYLGDADAVLALGGDNYSLDYGSLPRNCTDLDDIVIDSGKPLILWGASVGPFSRKPEYERYMLEQLRKTHILARETLTIEYLAGKGLVENVYRVADPAFLMEPVKPREETDLLEIEDGAIGLNLSPLMARFAANYDMKSWVARSADIVSEILRKTGRTVYLIPHVMCSPPNNDYEFLKEVLSLIPDRGRVVLVPDGFNAAETKWIISKMAVFAGARMHSTIASLSSYIPTLSFSYSMKSKGLNEDIFGHLDYCLEPHELVPDIVAERIQRVLQESPIIRRHLEQRIPEVKDLAMDAGRILKEVLSRTGVGV